MSQSFQQGTDQGTGNQDPNGQGTSFGNQNPGDNPGDGSGGVTPLISAEDLVVLQKRDEHAQGHITNLETEAKDLKTQMVEMQDKLDKAAAVEELLKDQGQQSTIDVDELTAKTLDAVKANLSAEKATEAADSNFDKVSTALTGKYGEQTDEAVKKACADNDMTFDDMVSLARKNPKLAMKLCEVEVKPDQQPSQSTINTSALPGQYQSKEPTPKVNVMDIRTDKERVEAWNARLDAKLKELNL